MQRLISGGYKNWQRTAAIAAYGLLWNGPSAHFWQKLMEHVFKGKSDMGTVLKKVQLDTIRCICLRSTISLLAACCRLPWTASLCCTFVPAPSQQHRTVKCSMACPLRHNVGPLLPHYVAYDRLFSRPFPTHTSKICGPEHEDM